MHISPTTLCQSINCHKIIDLAYIASNNQDYIAYIEYRQQTQRVDKKAAEFEEKTDAKIVVIVFSPRDSVYTYGDIQAMMELINKTIASGSTDVPEQTQYVGIIDGGSIEAEHGQLGCNGGSFDGGNLEAKH